MSCSSTFYEERNVIFFCDLNRRKFSHQCCLKAQTNSLPGTNRHGLKTLFSLEALGINQVSLHKDHYIFLNAYS